MRLCVKRMNAVLISVIMLAVSVSAFAQSAQPVQGSGVKPYGNLYLFMGISRETSYDAAKTETSSQDMLYNVLHDSNIGFSFQYARYSGVFELGLGNDNDERSVQVLKAYGDYRSDYGDLMIGQAYNPYVRWSNESANLNRSKNFGALYEEPTAQLMLKTKFGFYIDIIKPYIPTETYYADTEFSIDGASTSEYSMAKIDREVTTKLKRSSINALFPRIALGFKYDSPIVDFGFGTAMNAYKIESSGTEKFNKAWVKSYVAYSNFQVKYKGFSLLVNGGGSINPANMGISVQSAGNAVYTAGAACAVDNIATGKKELKDTWNIQAFAELGYEFVSGIDFYAGYGFSAVDYPIQNTERDLAAAYYANAKFNVGGLITLTPSFSYHDNKKNMNGNKEGNEIIAGLLATVSFY